MIKQVLPILKQNQEKKHRGNNKPLVAHSSTNFKTSIEEFNKFYIQICEKIAGETTRFDIQKLKTLKKASHILCEIQKYADTRKFKEMPQWLDTVIDYALNSNNQRV